MAYREVTRVETEEVLRQWVGGAGCKRISARLGLDVKTVRRYVHAAQALGLTPTSGEAALTDELITALLASMRTQAGRPRGEAWERCQAHRSGSNSYSRKDCGCLSCASSCCAKAYKSPMRPYIGSRSLNSDSAAQPRPCRSPTVRRARNFKSTRVGWDIGAGRPGVTDGAFVPGFSPLSTRVTGAYGRAYRRPRRVRSRRASRPGYSSAASSACCCRTTPRRSSCWPIHWMRVAYAGP